MSRRRLLGGLIVGSVAASAGMISARPVRGAGIRVAPDFEIQPRSAWAGDSRPPTGPLNGEDVRFLLVHHTASANGADPVGVMQAAYSFHTGPEKGWPDVAYNFFIDQNGVVWEGRAGSFDGPVEASATGGSQGFAQLVCLIGDFTSVLPTPAALAALNQTLAWLADRYSISTEAGAQVTFTSRGSNLWPAGETVTAATISGHRDMSRTACPGDTFYPYLITRVRGEVDALRAPPPSAPSTEPTAPTTTAPVPTTTTTQVRDTTTTSSTAPPTTEAQVDDALASAGPAPSSSVAAPPADVDDDGGGSGPALPLIGIAGALAAGGAIWYTARRSGSAAGDQHTDDGVPTSVDPAGTADVSRNSPRDPRGDRAGGT